jgi:hypothetical protein
MLLEYPRKQGGIVASYRIVVRDLLSESFAAAVDPALRQTEDGGRTALAGPLVDQSQLIGMINHLHDLGIEIIGFEVIDDESRP